MASAGPGCAVCMQRLPLMKRCTGCRLLLYCSLGCQKRHWPVHRGQCTSASIYSTPLEASPEEGCFEHAVVADKCIHNEKVIQTDIYLDTTEGVDTSDKGNVFTIKVRHNNKKHELQIPKSATEEDSLALISKHLKIPLEKMRLICKGKMINKENILGFLGDDVHFQGFGEQAECEDGLVVKDIEVLMTQLSVERNVAVRALREKNDLIDAILYVADRI